VAALLTDKIIAGDVIWAGVGEEAWDEEKIPPHPDPLPQGGEGIARKNWKGDCYEKLESGFFLKTGGGIARKNLRGVTRKIKEGISRGQANYIFME
jgi:hypothetical protein